MSRWIYSSGSRGEDAHTSIISIEVKTLSIFSL
jgi:hypothetical protein